MKINRLEKTKQNKQTNKQTVMLVKNILTETEPAICHCEGVAVVKKRQFMGRCPVYRGEPLRRWSFLGRQPVYGGDRCRRMTAEETFRIK